MMKYSIHIYIYGTLFIHEKHNNVIYSNMDYHTKWSKPDWERQISYDIAYMCNLKYDTNEPSYET